MIAMLPLVHRGYGFDTFSSKLGGVGVKWHSEYPKSDFSTDTPPFAGTAVTAANISGLSTDGVDGTIAAKLTERR